MSRGREPLREGKIVATYVIDGGIVNINDAYINYDPAEIRRRLDNISQIWGASLVRKALKEKETK